MPDQLEVPAFTAMKREAGVTKFAAGGAQASFDFFVLAPQVIFRTAETFATMAQFFQALLQRSHHGRAIRAVTVGRF